MADLVGLWLGAQATGVLVKPILTELAKDIGKDSLKDFFKDALKEVMHLPDEKILKEAYGKALKEFLELMEAEIENANTHRVEQIWEYERPLLAFLKHENVAAALGRSFELNCKSIDSTLLGHTWEQTSPLPLPEDFDWDLVSKQYVRAVRKLVNESEKLKTIHIAQATLATAAGIRDIAGISPDFDLKQYAEGLRKEYGNVKLESLDTTGAYYNELKLWKIFVPQMVRECQEFLPQAYELPKEHERRLRSRGELDGEKVTEAELERYHRAYRSQLSRSILEIVAGDTPLQKVVILGDPGAGKSSLLQYLALIWAEQPTRDLPLDPTPLLIELRSYARDREERKCDDILTFIHSGNIICRLDRVQLHDRLKAGQAVALFDGVDEIFDPAMRETVVRDIHRFTNEYPQVRTIVTSRWLGYKMQQLRDAGFRHFMLQDLEDAQIQDFIDKWHDLTFTPGAEKERKQTRLEKAMRDSRAIRELAGNPLLLTMMAILNRHQELPRDRSELYNQASRVLLHQWDVETKLLEDPKLKDLRISLDYRDKQAMLRKVAYFMQSSAKGLAGNIISATDLENILTEHLRSIIDRGEPRMVARQTIEQLRHRNFILCYLGADSYAFVHRTFLEYFCAEEFVWQFEKTKTLTIEQLVAEVFAPHWQDETWHEVLRLISSSIEAKFVTEIVNYLLAQKIDRSAFLDEYDKQKKEGLINIILAADCFEEVRNKYEIPNTETLLMKVLWQEIELDLPFTLSFESALLLTFLIANIGRDRPETLQSLKDCLIKNSHSLSYISQSAAHSIVQGWKDDPDVLSWLKHCAQHDDSLFVRHATVQAITQGCKDDVNTLTWLRHCAQHNNNLDVRYTTILALAQDWKDDPDTLVILKYCAQQDDSWLIRCGTIEAIAQGWKEDPQMFKFLCDRAIQDPFEREEGFENNPRQTALAAILENYPDRAEIFDLLRDRSTNDPDEQMRKFAEEQLAIWQSRTA